MTQSAAPTLLAYHGDPAIKAKYLARVQAHREADELIKGQYWEDGKGCAVGCTIHGSKHARYEIELGIPQMLARLEDCIFEGLPNGNAKKWPERFLSAAQPGQDLSLVGWKFLHWLLTDETVNPGITHPLVKNAVKQCADVLLPLTKGESMDASAYSAADSAASSAAYSAASAADSAASSAYSAADSAASSAAYSAYSAARSAYSAAYVKMSDKLIELMEAA